MTPREVLATAGIVIWYVVFGYVACGAWDTDYALHDERVVAHAESIDFAGQVAR